LFNTLTTPFTEFNLQALFAESSASLNPQFNRYHVLDKPCTDLKLIQPPRTKGIPDIVSVAKTLTLFMATDHVSYRVPSRKRGLKNAHLAQYPWSVQETGARPVLYGNFCGACTVTSLVLLSPAAL
jgi:hypothetical protein